MVSLVISHGSSTSPSSISSIVWRPSIRCQLLLMMAVVLYQALLRAGFLGLSTDHSWWFSWWRGLALSGCSSLAQIANCPNQLQWSHSHRGQICPYLATVIYAIVGQNCWSRVDFRFHSSTNLILGGKSQSNSIVMTRDTVLCSVRSSTFLRCTWVWATQRS